MLHSTNPALSENFLGGGFRDFDARDTQMSVQGTVVKAMILGIVLAVTATYTWRIPLVDGGATMKGYLAVGAIGGLILGLITIVKKQWAMFTAPLYAACEGVFLGGISSLMENRFHGIVFEACGATVCVFFSMLILYTSGVIRATNGFKRGVIVATAGIALFYLASIILGLFGMGIPMVNGNGPIGIAVSVVISIVAALNLVLDFDLIEQGAKQRAPKYMEWYGAFALLVTLVWLYLELLRLLSKLKDRD